MNEEQKPNEKQKPNEDRVVLNISKQGRQFSVRRSGRSQAPDGDSQQAYTREEFDEAVRREIYKRNYRYTLRSTISSLITVAAVVVLISFLLMPVLQIFGTSMTPTLEEGNIVVSVKGSSFRTGDVVALYYGNKILIKRLIGNPGDWIDIAEDGTVSVNGEVLDEPYVDELAFGDCDLELPYQVPEAHYFVLGDHRSVSTDSRNSMVGVIGEEQIVGKVFLRIWPLPKFGAVH